MLKINDKVKIVKGVSKSDDIYEVTKSEFDVCGVTCVKIYCKEKDRYYSAYDITFLEKVSD